MGGFGSGRPSGFGRRTADTCHSIDVNRLYREGCLQPGRQGGWEWFRDGKIVASISLRAEDDRLHLSYRMRVGGDWQDVKESVCIIRVPCRFGGTRPYFICPGAMHGVVCRRRVVKLYGAGRYFLCRRCYRLSYASRSEGTWDRALRRANKVRMRLGGDPGMVSPFPERPKGMWVKTYERLRKEVFAAERIADVAISMKMESLLSKLEHSCGKKDLKDE